MWLLTATLESFLAGHHEGALPAALVSGLLLLACCGLYPFGRGVARATRRKPSPVTRPREQRLAPRWQPPLRFGFAHPCLAAAFAAVALDPRGVAGFYYHPRMVAVVHLVTLGWITASILGAVYMIGPMALRMPMPARTADRWAFGLFATGVIGMVIHFW